MTHTEMASIIESTFNAVFPDYVIATESVPEEPGSLQAVVYGVPLDQVAAVEKVIYELRERELSTMGFALVPMVVDIEDTEMYYPEIVGAIIERRYRHALSHLQALVAQNLDSYLAMPAETRGDKTRCDANVDLALAA